VNLIYCDRPRETVFYPYAVTHLFVNKICLVKLWLVCFFLPLFSFGKEWATVRPEIRLRAMESSVDETNRRDMFEKDDVSVLWLISIGLVIFAFTVYSRNLSHPENEES
jgi:hypothetical protein